MTKANMRIMTNKQIWRVSALLGICASLLIGANVHADFVCSQDLDADGFADGTGETATCVATPTGVTPPTDHLCPISAVDCTISSVETCPLDPALTCTGGVCSKPAACLPIFFGLSMCSATGAITSDGACAVSCKDSAACTSTPSPPSAATCPLDPATKCQDNAGKMQCSPNSCLDTSTTLPVGSNIDTSSMLQDDGARNADGSCGGQLIIFAGKASQCRPSGWQTLSRDCCHSDGDVMSDSYGSATELTLAIEAVQLMYNTAMVAYATYSYEVSLGASATSAASSATTVATDYLTVAVDPTTIAIAVAVAVIIDMYAKACDKDEMMTALLNKSGYCHYTGSYCKEKWVDKCVQRARTFCCFNSKMARIIQEQGRPQLKSFASGWASADPKRPDCRGFTAQEFQLLDFAKIDFSEYYDELMKHLDPAKQTSLINDVNTKTNQFYTDSLGPAP